MVEKNSSLAASVCPACNGPLQVSPETYRNWYWPNFKAFDALFFHVCERCGLAVALPELSDVELGEFYGKLYRAPEGNSYRDFRQAPINVLNHRAVAQISLASAFCDWKSGDVFLDVGAGEGSALLAAPALLPSAKLVAIELSEGAEAFYGRHMGAEVHRSLGDFIATGRRARIILMSHSLEHYRPSDLDGLFRDIGLALAPGGVLLIEVPNVDLRNADFDRRGDSPHLLFFTTDALERMLMKYGFSVPFIRTCGEPVGAALPPDIENDASRRRRGRRNRLRGMTPVWLLRLARALLSLRAPSRVFLGVSAGAYGGERESLRAAAVKGPAAAAVRQE